MKHYIWLNPVVLAMYEEEQLQAALTELGYDIVVCQRDHIADVKEQYRGAVTSSRGCVMDMRCPAAVAYVKDELLKEAEDAENENGDWNDAVTFPEIEPILIHAARELAQRLDFSDGSDLTIITPCRELKALGEEKGLEHIHFLTWNEFAKASGLKLVRRDLSDSPIPPGFFAEYGDDMACLSSKEAIEQFFKEKGYRKKWIAEMLFCHQGCHNGNGVI